MKKPFWYKKPFSLPVFDETNTWEKWEQDTKKNYPIQFFFREIIGSFLRNIKNRFRDMKYAISCFFFPCHQEIRKAVPKHWTDISHLIVDVNFAMILSFKKEADESCVDWSSEEGSKFKNWLDSSAHWITVEREELLNQKKNSYPSDPFSAENQEKTYDELYHDVISLEEIISQRDTQILKEMIDYREYMWT